MLQPKKNKGFTLIEILIVVGIMAMLMALSAPFVSSLRADTSIQQTLRQVKVDLVSTLSYSLAGKSFAAISADDLMNPDFIPEAYALYFQVQDKDGYQPPYHYLEFTSSTSLEEKALKSSYQKENEYPNSTVFLKEIYLLNSTDQTTVKAEAAYIFILPPFGRVVFVNENLDTLDNFSQEKIQESIQSYDQIQMTFQYKDDEKNVSKLTFDKSKILNIL